MASDITTSLHNDSRITVVLIDGKIFELVPSEIWTWDSLCKESTNTRPHVRHLSPIPLRTKEEQKNKNQADLEFHKLWEQIPQQASTPLSRAKKAMSQGSKPSQQVQELRELKKQALKKGDKKEVRRIRKALRNLDHKRYNKPEEK